MKVYCYIKIAEHPELNSAGSQKGDVIYFYPMVEDQGKDTLNHFYPVVVDINIPCGPKNFENPPWHCGRCQYNEPESCDVIKYTRGVWSVGDIFNTPVLLKKRKYYIDRSKFIDSTIEAILIKPEKTIEEINTIISYSIINEKVAISIIKVKK